MNPEFVEALVPSACGSTWALDTSAPTTRPLRRHNFYNVLESGWPLSHGTFAFATSVGGRPIDLEMRLVGILFLGYDYMRFDGESQSRIVDICGHGCAHLLKERLSNCFANFSNMVS